MPLMNPISQQNLIWSKDGLKKGGRHGIPTSPKRESLTYFGCLNLKTQKFYWKKSNKANSSQFIWFLTQLRQRTPEKQIIIILDNATIHKSKKVRRYLKRHKQIHLFFLPPYSPEYNPVEIFWKWLKPKVYGFSAFGGIENLIRRFRKIVWHYNNDLLINPIKFNLATYVNIL